MMDNGDNNNNNSSTFIDSLNDADFDYLQFSESREEI